METAALDEAIGRRRTFAIISHPDAGKTTLTEKLLLYGGALHMAGAVKARKASRHAVSDWMEMEKEKGISITSSVLQFDYQGCRLNLLDTPGHADFSEDTYRTLAAVDAAVMLIDVAKGVEDRTLRLFEVCRMRKLPVITFVNKCDRPGRDPLDLMAEVGRTLNIRTTAANWPVGQGTEFRGVLDRRTNEVTVYDRVAGGTDVLESRVYALGDEGLGDEVDASVLEELELSAALLDEAGDPFTEEAFLHGDITPFYFGSAMTNQGVGPLLDALVRLAPPPRPRPAVVGERAPRDPFSGLVFKIQANMNPRHRDRIAFMRVVSGAFERGMEVVVARTGKAIRLSKPHSFMASERSIVDDAVAGDIVGLYDPGELRIGDTLFAGGDAVRFQGIPRFAPELFSRIILKDPTRRKHLGEGLRQLAQEGTVQLFFREGLGPVDPYVGAVGQLQFEVLTERLKNEYNVKVVLEGQPFRVARWIVGSDDAVAWFRKRSDYLVVEDRDGRPVVLANTPWGLSYALQENPGLELWDTSPLENRDTPS